MIMVYYMSCEFNLCIKISPEPIQHQASWENYHRRRDEIVKDCNPPDREAQLGADCPHII